MSCQRAVFLLIWKWLYATKLLKFVFFLPAFDINLTLFKLELEKRGL